MLMVLLNHTKNGLTSPIKQVLNRKAKTLHTNFQYLNRNLINKRWLREEGGLTLIFMVKLINLSKGKEKIR
jgi:hypothetical protein